ncbi:retrovirus-related pol polyprotein from transposon TNT 1-94, partial [Tanacetum coccineum]
VCPFRQRFVSSGLAFSVAVYQGLVLILSLLKDIYTLINHYTDANYIWDNVKMLLKEQRRIHSRIVCQVYKAHQRHANHQDDYAQDAAELKLYAYLKQHEAHANKNKIMLERYNQQAIDPLALVSNGRHNRGQGNYARGAVAAGNGGVQNRVDNANPGQVRQIKCYSCNRIGHIARTCTQPKRP